MKESLPAAQLAQAHRDQPVARQPAMDPGEFRLHMGLQLGDRAVGDIGQRPAGGIGAHHAPENAHAHLELPVLGPAAHDLQHVLIVIGLIELDAEIGAQMIPVRHGIEETLHQHRHPAGRHCG